MRSLARVLFAVILFAVWALAFFILGWFVSAFAIGRLGLTAGYEMPIMAVMLLLCLITYTFFLNFVLTKVSR